VFVALLAGDMILQNKQIYNQSGTSLSEAGCVLNSGRKFMGFIGGTGKNTEATMMCCTAVIALTEPAALSTLQWELNE
jgi:hypothetical protein